MRLSVKWPSRCYQDGKLKKSNGDCRRLLWIILFRHLCQTEKEFCWFNTSFLFISFILVMLNLIRQPQLFLSLLKLPVIICVCGFHFSFSSLFLTSCLNLIVCFSRVKHASPAYSPFWFSFCFFVYSLWLFLFSLYVPLHLFLMLPPLPLCLS